MQTHLTLLGGIYTALGSIGVLIAAISVVAIAGGGMISGDPEAIKITSAVSVFVGALLVIPAIPFLIGGVGLLRTAPWSRLLVLILGFCSLIVIPFGTILGAYTIWVMTKPEVIDLLSEDVSY